MTLTFADWLVIGLYGVVIADVGFVLVRKARTAEDFSWPVAV